MSLIDLDAFSTVRLRALSLALMRRVVAADAPMDRQTARAQAMIAAARNAFAPLDIRVERGRVRFAPARAAVALLDEPDAI